MNQIKAFEEQWEAAKARLKVQYSLVDRDIEKFHNYKRQFATGYLFDPANFLPGFYHILQPANKSTDRNPYTAKVHVTHMLWSKQVDKAKQLNATCFHFVYYCVYQKKKETRVKLETTCYLDLDSYEPVNPK